MDWLMFNTEIFYLWIHSGCTCNVWCNVLSRIGRSIGRHFKRSVNTLITYLQYNTCNQIPHILSQYGSRLQVRLRSTWRRGAVPWTRWRACWVTMPTSWPRTRTAGRQSTTLRSSTITPSWGWWSGRTRG